MGILILDKNRDMTPWVAALQQQLPAANIEVYPKVKDAAAIDFVITMRPDQASFQQFPNIKVVHCIGAGVNYILESKVVTEDMLLARIVDPYLTEDMWEFVLSVVLTQIKNLPIFVEQQRQQKWKPMPYRRFKETNIAVLGLGKIGAYTAAEFAKLGFQVTGWSNSKKNILGVESYIGLEQLPNCLEKADFLVNILPLTASTKHILNKTNLQHLPQGAFLINVGRGQHNQESDIIELLDSGHLLGALLDVFSQEPLPVSHPFWHHPKVYITPHIASVTNAHSAVTQIADNYRRFKKGIALENVVSLEKGY